MCAEARDDGPTFTRDVMVVLFERRWRVGQREPVPFTLLWPCWRSYLEASEGRLVYPEQTSVRRKLRRTLEGLVRSGHLVAQDDAYRWNGQAPAPLLTRARAAPAWAADSPETT
jgi:hypothetical protein